MRNMYESQEEFEHYECGEETVMGEMQKAQDDLDASKKQIDDNLSMSVKPVFMTNNIEHDHHNPTFCTRCKLDALNNIENEVERIVEEFRAFMPSGVYSETSHPDLSETYPEYTNHTERVVDWLRTKLTSLTEQHQREKEAIYHTFWESINNMTWLKNDDGVTELKKGVLYVPVADVLALIDNN